MKQQEILEGLQNIIMPYLEYLCEIRMETDLAKDLLINSVDLINIIIEVEDTFHCSMAHDQMLSVRLVGDLVQYIINSNKNI